MDTALPIAFPGTAADLLEGDARRARALAEIQVAIELVARDAAVRVRISGLPGLTSVAASAASLAQQAGVEFTLDRGASPGAATVGPRVRADR